MPVQHFPFSLRHALPALLLALALFSCLDEIDLNQGAALPEGIVLQGRINAGAPSDVRIRLERLFRFENSNRPDQVANATVVLENSDGQTLNLPFRDGAYRATIPAGDPNFLVAPGLGYRVRVATREGEAYETDFDVLPAPLAPDGASGEPSIVTRLNAAGDEIMVPGFAYNISGPIRYPDGSPAFIRWTLEQTWKVTDEPGIFPFNENDPKVCYVTQPFEGNDLFLLNSLDIPANRVDNFPIAAQPRDFRYAEGNVMTIYQEALSRAAYEYFDQVRRIASTEASIFEPPGGPIVGNARDVNGLTSNVFGFFYATSRSEVRVPISPAQAENPGRFCPLVRSPSPNPQPNSCDDCLRIEGAELPRPSWFPF